MHFTAACVYLAGAAAVAAVAASPLSLATREKVAHDAINPMAERVQGGTIGEAMKKFEPFLHIAHGCQSYPAVDSNGNTGGGLQASGSATGGCRDLSKGQTYVRAGRHGGFLALMYSWYMPKDQTVSGISIGAHRHDWENIVLFIDDSSPSNLRLVKGSASSHGSYQKTSNPQRQGDRAKVEYFTEFPTNHELQFTNTLGRDLPMIDWDVLTETAREALETTSFGSANVPFKNANFANNLSEAA